MTVHGNGIPTDSEMYAPPIRHDVEYFGAAGVIAEELKSIRTRRGLPPDTSLETKDLCGLSLSGGGIRSASFSLGVMQALAYNGWLEKMDYLSTVSGGGYIGSSLTWALNSGPPEFGLDRTTFPFASFPMSGQAREVAQRIPLTDRIGGESIRYRGRLLHFLRQNATYLTPGKGLNLFALLWTALRGAILGLMVYGAILTLVFLVFFQWNLLQQMHTVPFIPRLLNLLPDFVMDNWFLLAAAFGLLLFLLSIPLYSLLTFIYHWILRNTGYPLRRLYEQAVGLILPALLTLLLFGAIPSLHNWVTAKGVEVKDQAEQLIISGSLAADGTLALRGGITPRVTEGTTNPRPSPCTAGDISSQPSARGSLWTNLKIEMKALAAGIGIIGIGLLSGGMAFFKTKSTTPGRIPLGITVSLAVATLLFGIFLFAYALAYAVSTTLGCNIFSARWFWYSVFATLVLAVCTNINHISLHRYYRDRLMETFLPDVEVVMKGEYSRAAMSCMANRALLKDMDKGLYHIINTNVVLASSNKPKFKVRGGDNFIFSPKYCGSYATGWQRTDSYSGGKMTLASAMAISGAAINPSAGCGGQGITRSPILSILMGLLNFRLGYWAPNPKCAGSWSRWLRNPDFILPGLWEVLFRNLLNENRSFLQLSDGGHFENLALYELVRRKLKMIIVCDGGADARFTFSDLANAMEKVRTDFGAMIMIDDEQLKQLIPREDTTMDGVATARQGYLVATINYADSSQGTLIYLTTTFFKGLSGDLYGYKKEHPAFPDEPTGDQFFDEKQFEAYRELGFQTAWKMMLDAGSPKLV